MKIMKWLLHTSNLAVGALQAALNQFTLSPNDAYDQYYYTKYTYENLENIYKWSTQSLQTINTNVANGINQGTDYVAGLIGTPPTSRRLQDSGVSYPKDTLHQRFGYIEDFLGVMSNDINDIGVAIGLKTQESNRGKTAKIAKKKKKNENLFAQAKAEDEEHKEPGLDRLLQVSLGKQIEAKIDSHYEKIGHLEDKMDKKIGHLEDKMDEKIGHLENKIDKLEDLILRLLDATQQKLV